MKCAECGSAMKVGRENVKYDGMMGLPVVLANVEVRRCAGCGEYEVVIPRLEELLGVLAGAVIRKSTRLTGDEVRFLGDMRGEPLLQLCVGRGQEGERHYQGQPDTRPT